MDFCIVIFALSVALFLGAWYFYAATRRFRRDAQEHIVDAQAIYRSVQENLAKAERINQSTTEALAKIEASKLEAKKSEV